MGTDTRWILLYTKPRAEAWVEINLRKDGFTTLLPRVRQRTGFAALFPRYLLAVSPDDDVVASLPGSVGILYVVHRGESPAEVPDDVVAELRGRMDARGIITLDPSPSADSLFAPSRRARVRALLRRARADVPSVA
ncbi:MAG TPA: transcription termination/antitermination NusG family protein [Gemmatimonadaceae bacterium]